MEDFPVDPRKFHTRFPMLVVSWFEPTGVERYPLADVAGYGLHLPVFSDEDLAERHIVTDGLEGVTLDVLPTRIDLVALIDELREEGVENVVFDRTSPSNYSFRGTVDEIRALLAKDMFL